MTLAEAAAICHPIVRVVPRPRCPGVFPWTCDAETFGNEAICDRCRLKLEHAEADQPSVWRGHDDLD